MMMIPFLRGYRHLCYAQIFSITLPSIFCIRGQHLSNTYLKLGSRPVNIAYRLKICYTDFVAVVLMYGGCPWLMA